MIIFLKNLPKNLLQFLISGLRPLLGPASCRYPIGCTKFALEQLENQSLPYALIAIGKRLISCGSVALKALLLTIFILLTCNSFLS